MNIEAAYRELKLANTDISEHMETLRRWVTAIPECTVVELGVRTGVSTVALLCGKPKKYIGYDINEAPPMMKEYAKEKEVAYFHNQCDVRQVTHYPNCNLLFIDTLHTGKQLWYELTTFGNHCHNVIIMHDTVSFGYQPENGIEGHRGLCPALFDFLAAHDEWQLAEWYTNNNGLAIMERRHA